MEEIEQRFDSINAVVAKIETPTNAAHIQALRTHLDWLRRLFREESK